MDVDVDVDANMLWTASGDRLAELIPVGFASVDV